MTPAQMRLAAAAAAFLALLALCGWQELRVHDAREELAQEQRDHQKTVNRYEKMLADGERQARQTEKGLRDSLAALQASAAKEMEDAKAREDALVESVRAGHRRLSVAARCPAGGDAGGGAAAAGGGGPALSRAELPTETAERILAIGRDADRNTRERNLCVEAYEDVRARLNTLNKRFNDAAR